MCEKCAELFASLSPPPPVQHPPPAPASGPAPPGPIPGLHIPAEVSLPADEPDFPPAPLKQANTALILSLVGLIVPITALIGLILGIISLLRINARPRAYSNRATAIIAVVLSLLFMTGHGVAYVYVFKFVKHYEYLMAHRELFLAINYFIGNAGVPPATLEDLAINDGRELDYLPEGGFYAGPYLWGTDGIGGGAVPKNPYARGTAIADHWTYDPETAELGSAVPLPARLPVSAEMEPSRPALPEDE